MFAVFIVLSAIASLACSQSSTVMPTSSSSPMGTNAWEDLLVKPLQMISELARVCIVMSRQDYSLDTSRPYTYIKYPASYRATLTQGINLVDNAFRTAERSMSRVEMITSQMSNEFETAPKIILKGRSEDRQMWLPSSLNTITKGANDVSSAVDEFLKELGEVTAFFQELLRAVQPSTPSSTPTVSTKSPLDINQAMAVSNIIAHLKSLTAIWDQLAQESSLLSLVATRSVKFIDDKYRMLSLMGGMDQTTDLLFRLASYYNRVSTQIITSRTSSMGEFLMLESEEDRLKKAQRVNEVTDHNIAAVQRGFANAMVDHQTHNLERNKEHTLMAATS